MNPIEIEPEIRALEIMTKDFSKPGDSIAPTTGSGATKKAKHLKITSEEVICHTSCWSDDGQTVEARVIIHARDEDGAFWEANKVIKCRFRKPPNADFRHTPS